MKRRDAIKRTALIMGYAVSASALAGVMSGCEADVKTPADTWKPKTFSDTQINTIREAAERILPATEGVVGAKDVMVERFIDALGTFYKPDELTRLKQGLDKFETDAKAAHNKTFTNLSADQMDAIITDVMNLAKGKEDDEELPFFLQLKEAVLLGYFSSEEVGERVLNYDPVPTKYDACINLTSVPKGRAWSL